MNTEQFRSALVEQPNGCLEWTGDTETAGYGRFKAHGKVVKTHRFAWTLANGPILDGLWVLHHCDNPPCCQTEPTEGYPDGHLFLGTPADNCADMAAKGRHYNQKKTRCPYGHKYTKANTYVKPGRPNRTCRTCRARDKARRVPSEVEAAGSRRRAKAWYAINRVQVLARMQAERDALKVAS